MSELEVLTAGLTAAGWAGRKMLGPTLDEIGRELKDRYSERRLRNFARIGRNAEAKAGPALEQPGEVSPRVAMKVLEEGSLCDGPVMAEYFGGILAGSRSPDGADDRGMTWAALVSRLSTMDVHLHYLAYEAFRRLYLGQMTLNWGMQPQRQAAEIYLADSDIYATMGRPVPALSETPDALNNLIREGLLGDIYAYGDANSLLEQSGIDAPGAGAVVTPSIPGLQLFMWAHNHGHLPFMLILLPQEGMFVSQEGLNGLERPRIAAEMRQERQVRLRREAEQASQLEPLQTRDKRRTDSASGH